MEERKLRELVTGDIFKMSRILQILNLSMDFKGKEQEQVGGELMMAIAANLHKAENEIAEFIGDLAGITAQEFKELPIDESMKLLAGFKDLKGVRDFFRLAGRSMQ